MEGHTSCFRRAVVAIGGLALLSGAVSGQSLLGAAQDTAPAMRQGGGPSVAPAGGQPVQERPSGSFAAGGPTPLFAVAGNGSPVTPGGFSVLNPATFAGALIADAISPGGFTGLAFTPDGRLWGTALFSFAGAVDLVEINPSTGALISQVPVTEGGNPVRISDLAVQPGTGVLYGSGGRLVGGFFLGEIFTIDTTTGVATFVGATGFPNDGGLAFDAAGTLYATIFTGELLTLDPATGGFLTSISFGPDAFLDGLVVRPSDGALLATRGGNGGGDQIVQVDPVTGLTVLLGSTGSGQPSDLAFAPLTGPPASCTFRNGLGGNPAIFTCTTNPIIGATWVTNITPAFDTLVTVLGVGLGGPTSGAFVFGWELLILPPIPVISTGFGTHTIPIPATATLVGVPAWSQGAQANTSGVVLCNAQDLTLAF